MVAVTMHVNSIASMGPDCSSWGLPARGTSLRSLINIHGNVLNGWVQRSSTMISRLLTCIHHGLEGSMRIDIEN